MSRRRKVLVTGGAGFIGSHTVVELIEKGYTPVIVDDFSRSDPSVLDGFKKILGITPKIYRINCLDLPALKEIVKSEGIFEGVIHFAAFKSVNESVENPLLYYENNIGSLVNILQLWEDFQMGSLVFSSSCTVYGQPEKLPVTEDSPILPAASPYGYTKQICEQLIFDFAKSKDNFRAVNLRYFNPIGAHESGFIGELPLGIPSNLVPFITQTAIGKRKKLTVYGADYPTEDGSCVRDYIHVMDLAAGHVEVLNYLSEGKKESGVEVFNVGTGKGVSVLELLKGFEEVNDLKLNYEIGDRREGDIAKIYSSNQKIISKIGWAPQRSIKDALRNSWEWEKYLESQKV